MKITCVGGGPAGLYFAILMKLQDPNHEITVLERDSTEAIGGWGITLQRSTVQALAINDTESAKKLRENSLEWDTHITELQGHRTFFPRTGLSFSRRGLLQAFRERALDLGIQLQFERKVEDTSQFGDSDLIVGADGINSRVRESNKEAFQPDITFGRNVFAWLGAAKLFRECTFAFARTDAGWLWLHADGLKDGNSACVVECSPETWTSLGLDQMNSEEGLAFLGRTFERTLDGQPMLSRSQDSEQLPWIRFRTLANRQWHHKNIVLIGDAAHTAHFSTGSGTKLALEDAMSLASNLRNDSDLTAALAAYQKERQPAVKAVQRDARTSQLWFENLERYAGLDASEFAVVLQDRTSPFLAHLPPRLYYKLRTTAPKVPGLRGLYGRLTRHRTTATQIT